MEVHANLGATIPVNGAGNPQINLFSSDVTLATNEKKITISSCVTSYTVTLPLNPQCKRGAEFSNMIYKLAAQAVVKFLGGTKEVAWSDGPKINDDGSWATYTEMELDCDCI